VLPSNLTDIFPLEDSPCEHCSVTGLSAHFADLLRLLDGTTCESKEEKGQSVPARYKGKLLGVLTARRPDLKKLEYTCANSQTMISYINRPLGKIIETHPDRVSIQSSKIE
jgi:hypothetical protein